MENELLKIFDENKRQIGVATREEVHRAGHWHEAFHCWFAGGNDEDCIYVQLRSDIKKDYPGLLDITAAGHLLSHEHVLDGVREIEEELGMAVSADQLECMGVVDYCIANEPFIDKEIAHLFLYRHRGDFSEFILQASEVSGIFKVKLADFSALWFEQCEQIRIQGFELDRGGNKVFLDKYVNRNHFVPHEAQYYRTVVDVIHKKIRA